MSNLSDYEKRMIKNREENKRVLASLGLDKPFLPLLSAQSKPKAKQGAKRKRTDSDEKPHKTQRRSADSLQKRELVQLNEDEDCKVNYGRRRSGRLMGKEPGDLQGLEFEVEDEEEKPKRTPRNRENIFGPIPGIEVGTTWSTRLACSADGVHRPTVAGIHGNAEEGCYSLALSGGYEDDLDYGDCFTYTGEGGRDLKGTKANPKNLRTAPQSKDQTLTRGNLALTKNVEKGHPVRVIRGYKSNSPFAPEEGYRYDGLYTVEKYWKSVGLSGFMVYKFALKRCDNQLPSTWNINKDEGNKVKDGVSAEGDKEEQEENIENENTVSCCESSNTKSSSDVNKMGHGTVKASESDTEKNSLDKSLAEQNQNSNIGDALCGKENIEQSDMSNQNQNTDQQKADSNDGNLREDDDGSKVTKITQKQADSDGKSNNVKARKDEDGVCDSIYDGDEKHVNSIQKKADSNDGNVKARLDDENQDGDEIA